jgi:hypothetical protein
VRTARTRDDEVVVVLAARRERMRALAAVVGAVTARTRPLLCVIVTGAETAVLLLLAADIIGTSAAGVADAAVGLVVSADDAVGVSTLVPLFAATVGDEFSADVTLGPAAYAPGVSALALVVGVVSVAGATVTPPSVVAAPLEIPPFACEEIDALMVAIAFG